MRAHRTLRALALALLATLLAAGDPPPAPAAEIPAAYLPLITTAPATLLAVGDIASCSSPGDEATALLADALAGPIAGLGDMAYPAGSAAEFSRCYAPSWGRHRSRTWPAPGNHDYLTPGAAGYYAYFGSQAGDPSRGYYSHDVAEWHLIALNSNCAAIGGCGAGSPQAQWLRDDLAAHPARCTLAYWHHPRFSSGPHGSNPITAELWQILYDADVDVALAGHEHSYERFAPQSPAGEADPARGIRQFIVGTGGVELRPVGPPIANSEARSSASYGLLLLELSPESYRWRFIPATGSFTDTGEAACH